MPPPKPRDVLRPTEARPGKQLSFGDVAIEIIEVNKVNGPFGWTQWIVSYRLHDNRQSPPFISNTAPIFVTESTDLKAEFKNIVQHYEQNKHLARR